MSAVRTWQTSDSVWLVGIILFAVVLRLAFFPGFFGSDEVTYAQMAADLAAGTWSNPTYIGAVRLGVNYPMAAAIQLFGMSEASLAAWAFLCSVLEVAVVFLVARGIGGQWLGIVSALILAMVPLHVAIAGRIDADAPAAFFITLSIGLFYFGERSGKWRYYLAAGAAAGAVYWIKEGASVYLLMLPIWALVQRTVDLRWGWAAVGYAIVVSMHFVTMWVLTGNPLQLIESAMASFTPPPGSHPRETGALIYFRYLFLDVRHTALLGPLAVAGVVIAGRKWGTRASKDLGHRFALCWGVILVAVYSFLVVSLDPLTLIPKQSNYMTMFLAPLAVLAGMAVQAFDSGRKQITALMIVAAVSLPLAGLQQQAIRSFVVNSRATFHFAENHPDAHVYVMRNAFRFHRWQQVVEPARAERAQMRDLGSIPAAVSVSDARTYVVVDPQTIGWGSPEISSLSTLPDCWQRGATLPVSLDWTAGRVVTRVVALLASVAPTPVASRADRVLAPLDSPQPAIVYEVPPGCVTSFGLPDAAKHVTTTRESVQGASE